MNRTLAALGVTTLLASPAIAVPATSDRPNIIVLLVDDMGYGDISANGGTVEPTPNIDRLAAQGTRFTQYYSASPICSPSRTGILTGCFPARHGITSFLNTPADNLARDMVDFLDPKAPSIARTLKSAGYATGHFGKWHMGGGRHIQAPSIREYGFDEYSSTWESPDPDPKLTASDWIWSPKDEVRRWKRTEYFVDKTIDFLKRHPGEPCYIDLWPDDVHTPWVPDMEYEKQGAKTSSCAALRPVLRELDVQVGRLTKALDDMGIADKTLILFTSDNGPAPSLQSERSGKINGATLRGAKASLYEAGIRMPGIVRWPGHAPAGRVDETSLIGSVDLLPTFAALAGTTAPTGDGESVLAAFNGKSFDRTKPMLFEYGRGERRWAYPPAPHRSPPLAAREGPWKLLMTPDGATIELYDITKDPGEKTNVAADHPDVVQKLKVELDAFKKTWPHREGGGTDRIADDGDSKDSRASPSH
ncbi:MAG: sulfatase-like hydrolase/transferase [Tepidisphaeraceae bacterium]